MKKSAGFTLIELIAVMLILAIMAVVAVPQFVDLRVQARQGAVAGIAGALASGSALNFAQRSLNAASGVQVLNCTAVAGTLQGGVLPTSETGAAYTITAAAVAAGATANCTVNHPSGNTATFTAIGIN